MKVNKDLADAVMMISCIILVLAGTSDFESSSMKTILMSVLGILAVGMGAARIYGSKHNKQHEIN
ncbi:MAG: hypothetical protein SOR57_08590 [Parabacteroides sp.]|nr:hypothetical protein [Parabacteroides sp.]